MHTEGILISAATGRVRDGFQIHGQLVTCNSVKQQQQTKINNGGKILYKILQILFFHPDVCLSLKISPEVSHILFYFIFQI